MCYSKCEEPQKSGCKVFVSSVGILYWRPCLETCTAQKPTQRSVSASSCTCSLPTFGPQFGITRGGKNDWLLATVGHYANQRSNTSTEYVTRKELLIKAIKHLHRYLYERQFAIGIDHIPPGLQ